MGKMKEKKGVKNTWAKPIYIYILKIPFQR
jgi:hypothetical protein